MKKWLLTLGLLAVLTIAAVGCSDSDSDTESSSADDSSEQTAEVKKELLNAQMGFANEISPFHQQVAAYEAALSDEASTEDVIKTAADSAKTAADDAAAALTDYELEGDLPDEQKQAYQDALATLQSYYEEVSTAIDASATSPDLEAANELFADFQSQIETIYTDADMQVPDMAQTLG